MKTFLEKIGLCIYFTGLSGSGKTTISNILKKEIIKNNERRLVTILDGDEIRENISKELGFSKKDRSINVRRIGYLANHIVRNNGIVICSNIAPYNEDRIYNRQLIQNSNKNYIEVFLNVNVEECIKRDTKGLYKSNINKIIESSKEYEKPTNSEIIINTNLYQPYECSNIIFNYLKKNKYIL